MPGFPPASPTLSQYSVELQGANIYGPVGVHNAVDILATPDGSYAFVYLPSGKTNVTINTGLLAVGPPIGTNTTGQEAEGPHCISSAGGAH